MSSEDDDNGGRASRKTQPAAFEIPAWALRPRTGGSLPSPPPDPDAAANAAALKLPQLDQRPST